MPRIANTIEPVTSSRGLAAASPGSSTQPNAEKPSSLVARVDGLDNRDTFGQPDRGCPHNGSNTQLPSCFRPVPASISAIDAHSLESHGALALPPNALQANLLQAFAESVYPYMPVVDLVPFVNIVCSRTAYSGQVSLLLYQAVMFSAVAFVDVEHLREAGYQTRKIARQVFFDRARVRPRPRLRQKKYHGNLTLSFLRCLACLFAYIQEASIRLQLRRRQFDSRTVRTPNDLLA